MKFLRLIFTLLVLASLVFGAVQLYQLFTDDPERDETPPVAFEEAPPIPPLKTLLVQSTKGSEEFRTVVCAQPGCQTQPHLPYFYQEDILVRFDSAAGQTRPIAQPTTLTAPRELFVSPDGTKITYWLDNIHEPEAELSELWLFDSAEGSSRLLMENVHVPDVLTQPRWNSAGSHLWFVADSGPGNASKIELIVVGVQPAEVSARFNNLEWAALRDVAESDLFDISFTGRSLAFVDQTFTGKSRLNLSHEGASLQRTSAAKGDIAYLQWLEDGSLLYAVVDNGGFSFWRIRGLVHSFIARREGTFIAAHGDVRGEYLAFVAGQSLYTLQLSSGFVQKQTDIPAFGDTLTLLHVSQDESAPSPSQETGALSQLEDAEMTAFVEKNLPAIVGEPTARPLRLLTTKQPNIVYVDYESETETRRILLTVRDATYPEWSIRARYEPAGGEWRKIQGGGLPDPDPLRLYEWEDALGGWVLKSEVN